MEGWVLVCADVAAPFPGGGGLTLHCPVSNVVGCSKGRDGLEGKVWLPRDIADGGVRCGQWQLSGISNSRGCVWLVAPLREQ